MRFVGFLEYTRTACAFLATASIRKFL